MKNKDPNLIAIGRHFKKLRQEQRMSQEDIAHKADLNFSYYGKIERGEQNPSILICLKIAWALEKKLPEIFPFI